MLSTDEFTKHGFSVTSITTVTVSRTTAIDVWGTSTIASGWSCLGNIPIMAILAGTSSVLGIVIRCEQIASSVLYVPCGLRVRCDIVGRSLNLWCALNVGCR